ncbi:MAG: ATP-binding cassette domain-containing protein [Akkermansia muciniphila]
MIHADQLSKEFGRFQAVKNASFQIEKGEIVGFLGPNGAGKTTTLRMLTGYLPPTSGTATIAGFDIVKNPLEARKHLGYLPEHVPLYDDQRVTEYLKFRARLKGISSKQIWPALRCRTMRPGSRAPQDDSHPFQRLPPARRPGGRPAGGTGPADP